MLRSAGTALRCALEASRGQSAVTSSLAFATQVTRLAGGSEAHTHTPKDCSKLLRLYGSADTAAHNAAFEPGFGITRHEKAKVQDAEPGTEDYNPAPHPSHLITDKGADYIEKYPVYTKEYAESVVPSHRPPKGTVDWLAYFSIQSVRWLFDVVTNYGPGKMNQDKWLTRVVFLETVAGVPGMVAGMIRHLHSLRLMRKDRGWIHTLLEEAENERMHLMTFMALKKPGPFFRATVLVAQGVYCNLFFFSYLVSPYYCHRLVGYLEEEAVTTYTHLLREMDAGKVPGWDTEEVPELARLYWRLPDGATMRDLILAVRADEACHSHVNHTLAGMKADAQNPFSPDSDKTA